MQGTQLLLAKKPSRVSLKQNVNAIVKSIRMEANQLQGEAGTEQ